MEETFKALVVDQRDGSHHTEIKQLTRADLPAGDVLVQVDYSSLNYKDGLAITGTGKVLRSFPMIPGIDLAGTVLESAAPEYQPGDKVLLTGWGIGERYWGGYTRLNRVRSEWLVPLPNGLSPLTAMALGTAGFTAMLAVTALEKAGVVPGERELLVTGAAGGVGSIAVALLARLGYRVAASTGRAETHEYLRSLGAQRIIERATLSNPGRPLEAETWAGAIDTVGGDTLAGVLRSTAYYGAVAACGNAGGVALNTTVFPFILRGIMLIGVESVMEPAESRRAAWNRLAALLPTELIESLAQVIGLEELPEYSQKIIAGQVRGRIAVRLS